MEPFTFTYIKRGAPLNDVMWYLCVDDGNGMDVTVTCNSAPTVDEAREAAMRMVNAITNAFASKFIVNSRKAKR